MDGYLLQYVHLSDGSKNTLLARVLYLSAENELVQHEVGFFEIEDYIQFADLNHNFLH